MIDPFKIEGPAVISFSGGRTSGYMLYRVLRAWAGVLPPNLFVLFANTGREREETLEFVHEVETHWGVHIHWLEFREGSPTFAEVTFETASRNGEPFTALIRKRQFLPNPIARFCTEMLKIRTFRDWMLAQGFFHWINTVGIRADEPRRVARMAGNNSRERWDVELPLASAGITKADVLAFWKTQPFDLRLKEWEGNCDLCFLKGRAKRERIMRDRPDLAAWWVERERERGSPRHRTVLGFGPTPHRTGLYSPPCRASQNSPLVMPAALNKMTTLRTAFVAAPLEG